MAEKAKRLSDPIAHELSIIFGEHKGSRWAPVNPEAIVLGLKGKPVADEGKTFVERLKSWFVGAGDEPTNLDFVCSLFCQAYYDLQNAMCINEDDVRQTAVEGVLEKFTAEFGKLNSEKAGKRHSAADQAKIDGIKDAHEKAGKALDKAAAALNAAKDHVSGLYPSESDVQQRKDGDTTNTDDAAKKAGQVLVEDLDYKAACEEIGEPFEGRIVNKGDEEGAYGDVEYADAKNKKYPVDTKEHAKAAWSYINQQKNADKYPSDELATIKSKIRAACDKFGVEISDDSSKSGELDMTKDEVAALVADAVKGAVAEAVTAVKADAQAELDAAKAAAAAEVEKAKADAAKAAADAETAQAAEAAEKAKRKAAEKTINDAARTPGSQSGGDERTQKGADGLTPLQRAVKAANSGSVIIAI